MEIKTLVRLIWHQPLSKPKNCDRIYKTWINQMMEYANLVNQMLCGLTSYMSNFILEWEPKCFTGSLVFPGVILRH